MSKENVAVVMRGWEHFGATGEPMDEITAPGFVWDMSGFPMLPGLEVEYRGADGVRRFLREWTESFDEWSIEVESVHDAGDKVVVVCRQHGRSKTSGVPVEMTVVQVFTLRDGLQTEMRMYADPAEAFAYAGIEP